MSTSPGRFTANVLPIAFAVVLWLVALQTRTFSVSHSVAVIPPVLPDSLVISNPGEIDSVTVVFTGRGAGALWDQLNGAPATIQLEKATGRIGDLPAPVPLEFDPAGIQWHGRMWSELEVSSVEPGRITAVFDSTGSRRVPVSIPTIGQTPSRYLWMTVNPSTVVIRGPSSLVASVDSMSTAVLMAGQPGTPVTVETGSPLLASEPAEVEARLARPVPVVSLSDL